MYYVMDLNMTVIWLVILVALVVIELLTMGLTTCLLYTSDAADD